MRYKRKYQKGGSTTEGTPTWGSYLSTGATLLPGVVDLFTETPEEKNIVETGDSYIEDAYRKLDIPFTNSNATLLQQSKSLPTWENLTIDDFGGEDNVLGSTLQGIASGAATGAITGNPFLAIGAGLINGATSFFNTNKKNNLKEEQVERANREGRNIMNRMYNNFNAAVDSTDVLNDRWKMQNMYNTNYAAFGGPLQTKGAIWDTDATYINSGGSHQSNPFGGVQYGVASDGLPNMVEEGEVVIKVKDNNTNNNHSFAEGGSMSSDYVLSNRKDMAPNLQELVDAKITDKPEYYEGWAPAAIYKDIVKKNHIDEIINRKDTKDYLDSLHSRIANMQETTRVRKEQEQLLEKLRKATPEEQDYIMQMMNIQQPIEEEYSDNQYAKGGSIHIKPSKKGTFTAAATKHGMGVQEFASKVLANKEDYSPAMVKKANFARNASKWHQWGGWTDQNELNNYYTQQFTDFWKNLQGRKGSNIKRAYLTGAQARQWVNQLSQGNEQQQALANMLKNQWGNDSTDWSDNASWEFKNKYSPKGTIVESSPYLQWAGDNAKMKDALWGIEHVPQLSVDNRYQQGVYNIPETFVPEPNKAPLATMTDITPEGTPILLKNVDNNVYTVNPNTGTIEAPFSNTFLTSNVNTDIYPSPTVVYDKVKIDTDAKTKDNNNNNYNNNGISDTSWILPTISGINLASDLAGWTNVADYSNADRVGDAILPSNYIGYDPNGRYVQPQLVDTNYLADKLANQGMAGINAARDLSGSNRATALAQLAGQNYLTQQAVGNSIAQSQIANNAAIQQAVQANNAVDRANAEGVFNAARANQAAWENYVNRYAAQKTAEAKLREDIDTQVAANRSANWNNFLENLEGYFENQRNRDMANLQYAWSGYQYKDKNGKIHLQYETPEEKKKAENLIKKQPKSKQNNYIVESV